MAKKRKKYNPIIQFQKRAKVIAHHYKFSFFYGIQKEAYAYLDDKKHMAWSDDEDDAFNKVRHHWSFLIGFLCRDAYGKAYIKSNELLISTELTLNEAQRELGKHHDDLADSVNKMQIITFFWMAKPVKDYEFSEKEIWQAVKDVNADKELMTMHEYEKQQKEKGNGGYSR